MEYSPHKKTYIVKARVDSSLKERLDARLSLFDINQSQAIREALAIWLNLNPTKKETQ